MSVRESACRHAAQLADAGLEMTVAGSFGSPGIRLRRRLFGWDDPPRMDGRRVLITGATSGIGQAAAARMADLGASVTIIGRDPQRTARAAEQLSCSRPADARPSHFVADLSLLAEARRAADEIVADGRTWDVLIHNAGALLHNYELTDEGFESTYATQVLSQHVLTSRLLPVLARGVAPRVIVVSSGGMYLEGLDVDSVEMSAGHYRGARAYARAKRAQVTLTEQWARRSSEPVQFHCMHPGWADTPGVQHSMPTFRAVTRPILRSADEGADTVVWLAGTTHLPAPSGTFWLDRRPRGTARLPGTTTDTRAAEALWDQVCRHSGQWPALAPQAQAAEEGDPSAGRRRPTHDLGAADDSAAPQ